MKQPPKNCELWVTGSCAEHRKLALVLPELDPSRTPLPKLVVCRTARCATRCHRKPRLDEQAPWGWPKGKGQDLTPER
jgi:hypothetical protein